MKKKQLWLICKEFAAPCREVTLEVAEEGAKIINETKKHPVKINLN